MTDEPKPSEQRGGTTPDEAEAREKGAWVETAAEGVVPPELGGSDEPATETGIAPEAGDAADALRDGGANAPAGEEPDLKDAPSASLRRDQAEPEG